MGKLKILSKEKEENDEPESGGVTPRWSIKRIVIALLLGVFLLALAYGSLLGLGTQKEKEEILGETLSKTDQTKPEIVIPSKEEIEDIIFEAKESLSQIDPADVVSSQPAIQNIINNLEQITQTETSVKEVVCKVVCGGN